jgi:hypothetical protein
MSAFFATSGNNRARRDPRRSHRAPSSLTRENAGYPRFQHPLVPVSEKISIYKKQLLFIDSCHRGSLDFDEEELTIGGVR